MRQFLSLKAFYEVAGKLLPGIFFLAFLLMGLGIWQGFFQVPPDHQQGEAFRIIYVHVPAAFGSLAIYTFIFINAVIFLIWRLKLADIFAACSAPIGATYTAIALVTGAIWGKPMWGTWWIWDARLTSELILLFIYFGYMGLRNAHVDPVLKAKMSGILAIIGMIDIPIVHFSVEWWNTLHQGATLLRFSKPSISTEMLLPLLAMMLAFALFYVGVLLMRMRTEILGREYKTQWVQMEIRARGLSISHRGSGTAF